MDLAIPYGTENKKLVPNLSKALFVAIKNSVNLGNLWPIFELFCGYFKSVQNFAIFCNILYTFCLCFATFCIKNAKFCNVLQRSCSP